ncbi:MAG TPA: hypothetical protein PK593_07890 [Thermomicrobiales bacterium]|jgi:hypothetical protein|nr:hypothetical protein [Chloroflexota bacterium]HQX63365.1 hypothetical protein [Thermomicrobiales bacterium]HBY45701.1 hypothetical protein [Chloroflexota bacterium]HCG30887.1 hypothetical protein [Chloroflexota bacterium]HQZ90755.1 hypothetical protein [Thermomicrobiales bacterium]
MTDRTRTTREPWSSEEIDAIVDAYFQMLGDEVAGRDVVKMHRYRELHRNELPSRTEKAIERKMQNISAVFDRHGLPFIQGLAPLRNTQADLESAVEERLIELVWIRRPKT